MVADENSAQSDAGLRYAPPLLPGRLIRRHKRFLADVALADGRVLQAHCPNTGAMTGCAAPGSAAWLWDSGNPKRKLRHTLELVAAGRRLVCVNTQRANQVFAAGIRAGLLPPLAGYDELRREPKIPGANGRFDLLLSDPARGECYVELKSLTLALQDGWGAFPDARSERALGHVLHLQRMAARPRTRAVLIFCVMHTGVQRTTTADDIHPTYGEALRAAMERGLEVYAWKCGITPDRLWVRHRLPFITPRPG